jgi:8-oxo-dGTP pyrophosphatase MutT (NUDIX family)
MPARKRPHSPPLPIRRQVSSGGVVFRRSGDRVDVVIIRPKGTERWQLPKGLVDLGETPEVTAQREVREETGVDGTVIAPIDTIQYWYVGADRDGTRVRFQKTVHFFLLGFDRGDVAEHDHEVADARWVAVDEAIDRLAFRNEKVVVEKAREMIATAGSPGL